MSEQEKSAAQQRIDNAVYGTPKIKPDEQRKYLGTFRERVCLTISVQELQEQDWTKALTAWSGILNRIKWRSNPSSSLHSSLL